MRARQAAPLLLVMLLASPAFSATINVTANATDTLNGANAQCSLREAITNINNAATIYADCAPTGAYGTSDTINIPAGTYTTTITGANEDLNASGDYDINKNVSIEGAGASSTTINGGGLDRVFHITGSYTVSISGVTITNGNAPYAITGGGGGIYNNSGMLTVTNSIISGNSATNGSAPMSDGGGGIYNNSGTLTVTNSTITNNTAGSGVGICNSGTLTVTNSAITNNSASVYGGGIYSNGLTATITNSTISRNSAGIGGNGGGIYNSGTNRSTLTITNSTISENTTGVGGDGGGIYSNNSFLTVTNSTISGNTADYGGGIANMYSLIVTNSTISSNTATLYGGGIANNGTLTLSNSIVSNQILGTDCHNNGGSITSNGYNLESSTSCGFTGTGDLQNTNPLLGALANNGGPTQTMALITGSPAIDAGSCVQTTDQRGTARPQGATCDIGAYEAVQYLVSATAGTGGSVIPSRSVLSGSTAVFTVTLDMGYIVDTVVGGTCQAGSWNGTTYTTGVVTGNCSVSFTFTSPIPPSYTVSATAGTGGSVAPRTRNVNQGSTASFTVTADTGYTTNTNVGGTCQAGLLNGTTYTTGVVTATCSVSFTFTAAPTTGSLTVNILSAEAVTAGAQWRVNGGPWQASGATLSPLLAGNPTVSFSSVAGYTAPANQVVVITGGGTTTGTGTYTAITASTGSLAVTILPPEAVTTGAQWRVDGGAWQTSGATVAGLTAGSHVVSYNTVTGYTSPANKPVTIALGQTATATGTYVVATGSGSLKVNISPVGAVNAGAQWRVDGGAWNANGATVTGLTAGSHTVSFSAVADYTSPEDRVVKITNGATATSTGMYKQNGSLRVTILPQGAVDAGAQWSVDGGTTWNNNGDTVTGLTSGKQTVTFKTAVTDLYSPPASRVVMITPGRTATATGTYTAGYNVLAKASTGGTATPAKQVVTTGGSTVTITVTPKTGYTTSATVGGTCVAGTWPTATTYTTGAVTQACTALFTFTKAPTVATGPALKITQTGATLTGKVNPENDSTTVTFEYVDDATYLVSFYASASTVSAAVLTGGKAQSVAVPLTALTCGTKYHFRVVGSNADPLSPKYGLDRAFTTRACADSAADSNTATTISPVSDFDGDGKSDILFRDAATGQTQAWMMDGITVTSNLVTSLNAGAYTSTSGWQAQGIGDFDGDKKYDLLWRDAESGLLAVWTMNGVTVVTSAMTSLNPGAYTATTGWLVQGIGDFDGDAKSDILWRDAGTGQTSIWFMDGATVATSVNTNINAGPYTPTAGWQVQGVGDFNGDGKSDILWRQIGTGKTAIWFMNGAYKSGGGYTSVQAGAYTSTTGWQVYGVGDFDGDRKADILWRNAQTGVTVVWFMNGAVRTSGAYTSVQPGPYTPVSGWQIQGVGDFNGDWKSDVLLRYAGTGQTFIWLMNGAVATGDWTSIPAGAYDSATGLQVLSEETIR